MKIGDVAQRTGLDAGTIRYYERIGLVSRPPRADNGYRCYSENNIRQLWFLRHARQFGFSIDECRELLALWANPQRRSAEVHQLVTEKVAAIDRHIRELQDMKTVLSELLAECPGNDSPHCAIIDKLAANSE
ncbi:MAG: Cu(I)-responsive transcriptional regulator [Gammaproteobacteria bacterium]|nr:MAG: Cu(I)-responsive transcriptional regulator [Gammaproteobacteria bacterium]